MSQPEPDTLREVSPHRDGNSDISRNINGKRSREYYQEDQLEAPRKLARLDIDHHSEQHWCRQPTNPSAGDPNSSLEQGLTTGPGHVVFVVEEGKRCPAICFDKELLSIIKQIAEFSREVREGEKAIQHAQSELEHIKSTVRSADYEEAKQAVEEAIKNLDFIEAGFPELKEAQRQYKNLTQENIWSKLKLDNSRAVSQIMIEHILNRENLLDAPPSKPQKLAEDTKDDSWEPAPVPESRVDNAPKSNGSETGPASSPTRLQSPTDAEDQTTPRQLALRHLRFAAEELTYWKDELVYMQDEYPQAVAAEQRYRRDQHPNRPASTTQTDIDLMILKNTQDATRKVIEAEEAFDRAEARAEGLGLGDILADPHACHYGEIYNEFQPPRAETNIVMLPAQRSRIEAWMASVPDLDGVGSLPREGDKEGEVEVIVDDWDVKSVELWDSVSLAAHDLYRKKIDMWQELAGRLREGGS